MELDWVVKSINFHRFLWQKSNKNYSVRQRTTFMDAAPAFKEYKKTKLMHLQRYCLCTLKAMCAGLSLLRMQMLVEYSQ